MAWCACAHHRNNYEGLPVGYEFRIDQVLSNLTNYAVALWGPETRVGH